MASTLKSLKKNWTYHSKKADMMIVEAKTFIESNVTERINAERHIKALQNKLEVLEHLANQISPLLDDNDEAQDSFCEESNSLADVVRDHIRELQIKTTGTPSKPDNTIIEPGPPTSHASGTTLQPAAATHQEVSYTSTHAAIPLSLIHI